MKRTARACWRTSLFGWVLLAVAQTAAAQEPATHLTQAFFYIEADAGWDAPVRVPAAVEHQVDAAAVALPHVRPRALASSSDTQAAPPEVAWYRLTVPPGASTPQALHDALFLYLPRWQTIGTVAVYADSQLAWRTGGNRVWNSFNRPLWVPLAQDPREQVPTVVWIRMASQQGVGGALSSAWIGTGDALLWRWRLRSWLQTDLVSLTTGAYSVIGLFALAVWCVRRREPLYALFFLASVAHAMRAAHYVMGEPPPMLPDAWFGWMTVNAVSWTQMCVFAFAFRVHGKRMPRLALAIVTLVLLGTLVTLPLPALTPHLSTMLPAVYIAAGLMTVVIAGSGLWASWKRRSREGLALFAFFSLNVPVGVHDLALQNYRIDIERIYLGPYTAIGLFVIFLVIVWRRYMGAIRGMETLNTSLEARLTARERELTDSHEQLRQLERQQTLAAERQRMMQDMHDGIGSSLTSALRMVERGQASSADTALVLKDCIDDLKLALDSLDPADADLLALLAAVRFRLTPRLKAAGITLTWSVQDVPALPWLDAQNALHVLRIVQEVLTNILKHSHATEIDLATSLEGEEVLVRLRDDGAAFTPAASLPQSQVGKGLAHVRNRTLALGARCQWETWEGGGGFCLWLPLQRSLPASDPTHQENRLQAPVGQTQSATEGMALGG
ncbi:MAG: sensor histidine kinase [Acidovorax sp.]|uniref:sensor histidine kinase n=1 Tax=Acidovorax sp. TaxID=1872122 RepID=UPI00391C4510